MQDFSPFGGLIQTPLRAFDHRFGKALFKLLYKLFICRIGLLKTVGTGLNHPLRSDVALPVFRESSAWRRCDPVDVDNKLCINLEFSCDATAHASGPRTEIIGQRAHLQNQNGMESVYFAIN